MGGCKLTEAGFGRKLKDLLEHEGLKNRRLVELLLVARRFRLPDGSGVLLGRDQTENATLKAAGDVGFVIAPTNCPGPTALMPAIRSEADLRLAFELVCSYAKCDRLDGDVALHLSEQDAPGKVRSIRIPRPYRREKFKEYQIC